MKLVGPLNWTRIVSGSFFAGIVVAGSGIVVAGHLTIEGFCIIVGIVPWQEVRGPTEVYIAHHNPRAAVDLPGGVLPVVYDKAVCQSYLDQSSHASGAKPLTREPLAAPKLGLYSRPSLADNMY